MTYTLWSHGQLVGYTDLDLHTVSPNLRQGFVEPAKGSESVFRDATGVMRAMAEQRRLRRERAPRAETGYLERFGAACNRRDALEFELRDETGQVVECDFIRVHDLHDDLDGLGDFDDEDAPETSADDADGLDDVAGLEGETDEWLAEIREHWNDEEMYHSSWPPPPPPDPRWDTSRYHLQVFLRSDLEPWQEL